MRTVCLAAVGLLAGCDLYFGGGGDDCAFADIAAFDLRNPQTGQCESLGSPGCGCGVCTGTAIPDWGSCFSPCESLDETTCIAMSGCRAAYDANSTIDIPPTFRGCWAVAASGPIEGGGCTKLDAYECSRHDDCSALYDGRDGAGSNFAACVAEHGHGCYGDDECGAGAHCSVSDGECNAPPGCGHNEVCPDVCYGRCVMDTTACATVDCAPGSHCEDHCTFEPNAPACAPMCVPDGGCS